MKYRYRVKYIKNGKEELTGLMDQRNAEILARYLRDMHGNAEVIDEEAGVVK